MNFDPLLSYGFWMMSKRFNVLDFYALKVLLKRLHKRSREIQKVKLDVSGNDHVSCECNKYKYLKPILFDLNTIHKCVSYPLDDYNSKKIRFVDDVQNVNEKLKLYKNHTKLMYTNKIWCERNSKMMNERNKLTVLGLMLCLNYDNFNYEKLHKRLDIIEVYVIGILLKYRNLLPIKKVFLNKIPRRLFELSDVGVERRCGVIDASREVGVCYRGVKMIMECVKGRVFILDDYGSLSCLGLKKLKKYFMRLDDCDFRIECIMQTHRFILPVDRENFNEIFIVLRVISWGDKRNCSPRKFIKYLRDNNIMMFHCESKTTMDVLYNNYCEQYTKYGEGITYNGIIIDGDVKLKFNRGYFEFKDTGDMRMVFDEGGYRSEYSGYFLLKFEEPYGNRIGRFYVYNRSTFVPIGDSMKIYNEKLHPSKYVVVKLYFNINDDVIEIIDLVYKPCVNLMNVIHLDAIWSS